MLDFKVKIGLVPDVRDLFDFATRKGIFEPAKGVESKNKLVKYLKENFENENTTFVDLEWLNEYGVEVCGFETFVVEEEHRKGAMYRADNWDFVGETSGSTKMHLHGIEKQFIRQQTSKKLVFCKWVKGKHLPTEYFATWNRPNICKNQMSLF